MVKDMNGLKSMDVGELSLVHDLVIPPKFKILDFEKYDGTKCSRTHLVAYCCKMVGYTNNEKLLIHVFQESLIGGASKWYLRLKKDQISTWRDLVRALLVYGGYNPRSTDPSKHEKRTR